MRVPFIDLNRQYFEDKKELDEAIFRVMSSGAYVMGKEALLFEEIFANYCGRKFGVGVNSGTDAIKIGLRALNIGQGDEVITVANTAVPTISAIRETGAVPVFADIDTYFAIDPLKIEEKISRKTKAIVVVHLYGQCAEMNLISDIARKNNLFVIEDCAQSAGATYRGKKAGSFGDIACFSFYPTKNLGACGDGGMILTDDNLIAKRLRRLGRYGMETTYYSLEEGYNSRLDEIQAAILSVKIKKLDEMNNNRIAIAKKYTEGIINKTILTPQVRPGAQHVFHLYVIRSSHREQLKNYLIENNIGFGIHYEFPIHLQDGYKFLNVKQGSLPETEQRSKEILSLPIFPQLKSNEINFVIETLNSFKA
jgi:dTDP-4-amino-4,6-dideoxygalactose transaminase